MAYFQFPKIDELTETCIRDKCSPVAQFVQNDTLPLKLTHHKILI